MTFYTPHSHRYTHKFRTLSPSQTVNTPLVGRDSWWHSTPPHAHHYTQACPSSPSHTVNTPLVGWDSDDILPPPPPLPVRYNPSPLSWLSFGLPHTLLTWLWCSLIPALPTPYCTHGAALWAPCCSCLASFAKVVHLNPSFTIIDLFLLSCSTSLSHPGFPGLRIVPSHPICPLSSTSWLQSTKIWDRSSSTSSPLWSSPCQNRLAGHSRV